MTDDLVSAAEVDMAAERAVLGALIVAPRIADDVWSAVAPAMFWDARHEVLAQVLQGMATAKAPVDPTLVLARLMAGGKVEQAGGGNYLHSLVANAWAPDHAPAWCTAIREAWQHRTLVVDATRFLQMARNPGVATVELAVELAALADKHATAGTPMQPVGGQTILDLLARSFPHVNLVPDLLWRGNRYLYTGQEGGGKALALDTPIPTPKGWTTMGGLSVGQEVFAADGSVTRIVAATEVMRGRPCYRVRFSDGAELIADANHQWLTETLACRGRAALQAKRGPTKKQGTDQRHLRRHYPSVVTTAEIAATLMARNGHAVNHSVEVAAPLQYPRQELPLDPYVLGVWLGDGHTKSAMITCADQEIVDHVRAAGILCEPIASGPYAWSLSAGRSARAPIGGRAVTRLRAAGVLGNKHIPDAYQRADVGQRIALLQGLMDTDGTVSNEGTGRGRGSGAASCEFSVCHERLARDVHALLLGLGIKVRWREAPATLNGRVVGTRYRLNFQTVLPVFRLTRKADRLSPLRTRRAKLRYITAVEPVASVPVRCIEVEHGSHLFLAGRECIPTHNSELSAQLAACAVAGLHPFGGEDHRPLRVQIIDAENDGRQTRGRYDRLIPIVEKLTDGRYIDWEHLFVENRPEGLSLLKPENVAWTRRVMETSRPDILFIGSLYKLYRGANVNDETAAGEVTAVLDDLRTRFECALVIEAHSAKAKDAQGRRFADPRGSSAFMGWPEFGHGLFRSQDDPGHKDVHLADLIRYRGDRERAEWPERLRRGFHDELPWVPPTQGDLERFAFERAQASRAAEGGAF